MRRALLFTGAGLMVAAAGLPSFAAPKQTARTVTNGFVRSNVLLPIGGKKAVSNPVPQDLSDLSGWTREELEVGLEKQYDVDVADVTRFLYSTEGRGLPQGKHQRQLSPLLQPEERSAGHAQRHHSRC